MKKIIVISDSHIPIRIDSTLFNKIEFKDFDYILCTGDIVDENTYFELTNQEAVFFGVHGNMDDYYIKQKLPQYRVVEIEGIKIGIIHGHQTGMAKPDKLVKYFKEKINIMIFGHSHKRYENTINDIKIINPGALCNGEYAIISIENDQFNISFEKIDL